MLVLAASVCAPAGAATYAKGIDVSHYNGAIDWTQVATASYRFVYAKATEGSTLIDPTYSINRTGAQELRPPRRRISLRPTRRHRRRDANRKRDRAGGLLPHVVQPQPGELPPALDLETKGGARAAALETWTTRGSTRSPRAPA